MTCYDVLESFDCMLTSALIAMLTSTASAQPSLLSESASSVRTGYKEDTERTADAAYSMSV